MKIIAVMRRLTTSGAAKPDLAAVEAALRVKKQLDGQAEITAACIGTEEHIPLLREAVAMGCDGAVLFRLPPCFTSFPEPSLYARMLSRVLPRLPFDAIFTSCYAVDADAIQSGILPAALLDIAFAGYAEEISADGEQGFIVKRQSEDRTQMLKLPFPCLISVLPQPGKRIYMTAVGITRAYTTDIPVIPIEEEYIGDRAPYVTLLQSQSRKERKRGRVLTVPTEEAITAIMETLGNNHII